MKKIVLFYLGFAPFFALHATIEQIGNNVEALALLENNARQFSSTGSNEQAPDIANIKKNPGSLVTHRSLMAKMSVSQYYFRYYSFDNQHDADELQKSMEMDGGTRVDWYYKDTNLCEQLVKLSQKFF